MRMGLMPSASQVKAGMVSSLVSHHLTIFHLMDTNVYDPQDPLSVDISTAAALKA